MSLKVYDRRFKEGWSPSIISSSDGFLSLMVLPSAELEVGLQSSFEPKQQSFKRQRSSANSFVIKCLSPVENISAGWTMLEKFGSLRNFVQNLKTSRVHLLIQSRPSVQFTGSAALLDRFHFPAQRLSDSWSYCRDSCFSFKYIVKKTASFLMQEHFLILVLLWLCFKPDSSN